MNKSIKKVILLFIAAPHLFAQNEAVEILERGQDYRVVRKANGESYTELRNGMHYKDGNQWKETIEEFVETQWGAQAIFGPHKVALRSNLTVPGAVQLTTVEGQVLSSNFTGVQYLDARTGKIIKLGVVKPAKLEILPHGQAIYRDACDGISADILLTYNSRGFESDLVLRERLPAPESLGLDPLTTRLQVVTEFLNPPKGEFDHKILRTERDSNLKNLMIKPNFEDTSAAFGSARFWEGTAFSDGQRPGSPADPEAIRVGKEWTPIELGLSLVESVEYRDCERLIQSLPGRGSGSNANGFRIDYNVINSSTSGNFTFNSGTTYWVQPSATNPTQSGGFGIGGTATFQTGAIIKYNKNSYLLLYGQIAVTGSSGNVIFTAADDNTVGDSVSTSTLSGQYAAQAFYSYYNVNWVYANKLLFKYCQIGIRIDQNIGAGTSHTFDNCRFEQCGTAIYAGAPCTATVNSPSFVGVTSIRGGAGTFNINSSVGGPYISTNDGFDGLNEYDAAGAAPDVAGAVAGSSIVQLINSKIQIYDKTTKQIPSNGTLALSSFFGKTVGGTSYPVGIVFDPRIVYDTFSQRWIATALDRGSSSILLAISPVNTPYPIISGWAKYVISTAIVGAPGSPAFADFDTIGFDANGVYIAINYESAATPTHAIFAIKRSEVNANTGTINPWSQLISSTELSAEIIQPVINYDATPAGAVEWFLVKRPPSSSPYQAGRIAYKGLTWNGTTFGLNMTLCG